MKLIMAVVQDADSHKLVTGLMNEGFGVTKLATTGGFLRSGNTTLMIGVEKGRINEAMTVIEKVCKSRKQVSASATNVTGSSGTYAPYPVEVMVGGATVFVLDVEKFLKF